MIAQACTLERPAPADLADGVDSADGVNAVNAVNAVNVVNAGDPGDPGDPGDAGDAGDAVTDLTAAELVARAKGGDSEAWDALVERYAPLIWSICRKHRLGRTDADDVAQSVWLRLVDQLDRVRDPAALPGWLATTARRECLRVLYMAHGPHAAMYARDVETLPDERIGLAEQGLLAAERQAALREAFAQLPPNGQQLISLLIADPPMPYADISAQLGIPVGSIGPNRSRYLSKMRRHPAIAALINS